MSSESMFPLINNNNTNIMTNKKRKNSMDEEENDYNTLLFNNNNNANKRVHTGYDSPESMLLDEQQKENNEEENITMNQPNYFNPLNQNELTTNFPPRSTTPPLSMTLAHYDESSGGYTSSMVKSTNEVSSSICTAMTPAYRCSSSRFGSCLI